MRFFTHPDTPTGSLAKSLITAGTVGFFIGTIPFFLTSSGQQSETSLVTAGITVGGSCIACFMGILIYGLDAHAHYAAEAVQEEEDSDEEPPSPL